MITLSIRKGRGSNETGAHVPATCTLEHKRSSTPGKPQ